MRIGVDTGGTFTDFAILGDDGLLSVLKVPSTPADPSLAILDGLEQIQPPPGFALIHGTTVATNALLERRGARTALLTTEGCRDVLEIARQTRVELYSLSPSARNPLIPRELRFEAEERLDWRGQVVVPLDMVSVESALDRIQESGAESVAICFLFSFLNPNHEQAAGRLAKKRGLLVSLSSEIAPELREYERTSTVCANAYVAPTMAHYLEELKRGIEQTDRLSIMQSSGGTLRADEAASAAVKTVLSGPAGGLVASARVANAAGIDRIITFDLGGTSTDVALIENTRRGAETMRAGEVAGIPLLTPMLDIHTVGAGGGSIARFDAGGGLRVGPESAGADPGPVAYGRGDRLTVTDSNVLLGRLPSDMRLAGTLPLNLTRVRTAFERESHERGMTPEALADGIVDVVNAQMARALRHISTERGHDPADYTLFSFGGAGGLHACALAEALGMYRILVPRYPGAFSALGLAVADVHREYAQSIFIPPATNDASSLGEALGAMSRRVRAEMKSEGVAARRVKLRTFVEARYVGQSYALRVPFARSLAGAVRAFHAAHQRRYGHCDRTQPVEIVTAVVTASGTTDRPEPRITMPEARGKSRLGDTRVWIEDQFRDVPVHARNRLCEGEQIIGPALVIQEDATTWIAGGWIGEVDSMANFRIETMD